MNEANDSHTSFVSQEHSSNLTFLSELRQEFDPLMALKIWVVMPACILFLPRCSSSRKSWLGINSASIWVADWLVIQALLSPRLRYLALLIVEAQKASKIFSPYSELPSLLSQSLLIGGFLFAICTVRWTRASRTYSLVWFMSLIVSNCKLCVLKASWSRRETLIYIFDWNSERRSWFSPTL